MTKRQIRLYGTTIHWPLFWDQRPVLSGEAFHELTKRAVHAGRTQVMLTGGTGKYWDAPRNSTLRQWLFKPTKLVEPITFIRGCADEATGPNLFAR